MKNPLVQFIDSHRNGNRGSDNLFDAAMEAALGDGFHVAPAIVDVGDEWTDYTTDIHFPSLPHGTVVVFILSISRSDSYMSAWLAVDETGDVLGQWSPTGIPFPEALRRGLAALAAKQDGKIDFGKFPIDFGINS